MKKCSTCGPKPRYTDQEILNWHAFEKVRAEGRFNMIMDLDAVKKSGLTRDDYMHVIANYSNMRDQIEAK